MTRPPGGGRLSSSRHRTALQCSCGGSATRRGIVPIRRVGPTRSIRTHTSPGHVAPSRNALDQVRHDGPAALPTMRQRRRHARARPQCGAYIVDRCMRGVSCPRPRRPGVSRLRGSGGSLERAPGELRDAFHSPQVFRPPSAAGLGLVAEPCDGVIRRLALPRRSTITRDGRASIVNKGAIQRVAVRSHRSIFLRTFSRASMNALSPDLSNPSGCTSNSMSNRL